MTSNSLALVRRSADPSLLAARLIITAARSLARDPTVIIDASHCLDIAASLARVLARPEASRESILAASPCVIERSGRVKTLVEMIEWEEGDEAAKLRLARLLLRTLKLLSSRWKCENSVDGRRAAQAGRMTGMNFGKYSLMSRPKNKNPKIRQKCETGRFPQGKSYYREEGAAADPVSGYRSGTSDDVVGE